jgi:hypothetical protein
MSGQQTGQLDCIPGSSVHKHLTHMCHNCGSRMVQSIEAKLQAAGFGVGASKVVGALQVMQRGSFHVTNLHWLKLAPASCLHYLLCAPAGMHSDPIHLAPVLQGGSASRRELRAQTVSDLKEIFPDLLDWKVGTAVSITNWQASSTAMWRLPSSYLSRVTWCLPSSPLTCLSCCQRRG